MARKKEFVPAQALARAMTVFWRHGFAGTSMEALMREMGIAKQSLYDTFGSKRNLYLKALAQYRDETNAGLRHVFESNRSVKDSFAKVLFGLSHESVEKHQQGCLLLSANLERDIGDAAIKDLLRGNQAIVESIFIEALRRAQKSGELSPRQDPAAISRFFVATIQGMRRAWPANSSPTEKRLNKSPRESLSRFFD